MGGIFVRLFACLALVFAIGCGDNLVPASDAAHIPSERKELTFFAFTKQLNPALSGDVIGRIVGTDITLTVPAGTNVGALIASFTTTGALVSVGAVEQRSGRAANNFAQPVMYRVMAEDRSFQIYTVTVTVMSAAGKDLTSFRFNMAQNAALSADVVGTITGTNIAATVPFGTDVTALVATFTTTGASVHVGAAVQVSGTTPNNFTSPVVYRVTAGDTTTKDYTVTVTIAPNTAKAITSFVFEDADNAALSGDVTATITGQAITATVPFGTDVTALVATFTTTGVSVHVGAMAQVSGTTANDFTAPVTYRVTAGDASTQDYIVTITVAPNPAKELTSFGFEAADNAGLPMDYPANIAGTNITVTLPFGTDRSALIPTFTTTGVAVTVGIVPQVSGVTANDFNSAVTYRVTAADATTQDYTVTVSLALNPAKDLTDFVFVDALNPGISITAIGTIGANTVAVTVPSNTDVTALIATFSTTGASVAVGGTPQFTSITPNDFTNPVTYTVTADDNSTKDYVVTVTVAAPLMCETLVAPAGGSVTQSNGGVWPSTATFACDPGAAAIPLNMERTCQWPSGLYDNFSPMCVPTIMVVKVGDGTPLSNAATAAVLEERAINGDLVRTIPLPTAASGANNAFTLMGTSNADGALALSGSGTYVSVPGYAASPGTADPGGTPSATVPRAVARIAWDGTVDTSTLIDDALSSAVIRGATSVDGSAFWVTGGSGGVRRVALGSTGASTSVSTTIANLRRVQIYGNQLYASSASGTDGIYSIGTGVPATAGETATLIAGTGDAPHGFALLDESNLEPGLDRMYVAINTTPVALSNRINIQKWNKVAGIWLQDLSWAPGYFGAAGTTSVGAIGLAAFKSAGIVRIVATTTGGDNNQVVILADDGIAPGSFVIGSAGSNYAFRGVAPSPVAP